MGRVSGPDIEDPSLVIFKLISCTAPIDVLILTDLETIHQMGDSGD